MNPDFLIQTRQLGRQRQNGPYAESVIGMRNDKHATYLSLIEQARSRAQTHGPETLISLPSAASLVDDYASNPEKLQSYATRVIPRRIKLLELLAITKTGLFSDMYLDGIEKGNPYIVTSAARMQLETYAVVAEVATVVDKQRGSHKKDFVHRVRLTDESLIKATHGTKSDWIKAVLKDGPSLSSSRETRAEDWDLLEAKNMISRIDKIARVTEYLELKHDYEILCELVHPNFSQNSLLIEPVPEAGKSVIRVSRNGKQVMSVAIGASCRPMAHASVGAIDALKEHPFPFGQPPPGTPPGWR